MTRKHDERYARALARLKPEHIAATKERVDAAIAKSKNRQLPANFAEDYTNHKLGIRKERKPT